MTWRKDEFKALLQFPLAYRDEKKSRRYHRGKLNSAYYYQQVLVDGLLPDNKKPALHMDP